MPRLHLLTLMVLPLAACQASLGSESITPDLADVERSAALLVDWLVGAWPGGGGD